MDESLRTAIEQLLAVELSSLPDAAVREGFVALRACAELVELACARWAAAVEQRGLADADGAVSTPAWIEHHTGQVRAEARASVRTGAGLACWAWTDRLATPSTSIKLAWVTG